ncbi:MAG: hypothetical protein HY828_00490 [Actinobacteria bacterium]|nr:hypothetical protein [Actinomycetota bacterium]
MEVDLFDNGDAVTPRPAWQVIEAARRRYLTGVLTLDTTPPTNIYLRDGQVYFAERTTDGGLGVRLLVEGVITREQMHKATLQVSGVEHLGRMFERDASIDRDAVELCVELMTDDVLTTVAAHQVDSWKLQLYKRHPSGLDRWLPTRVEVVTHIVEGHHLADQDAVVTPGDGPRQRPHLTPPPTPAAPPAVVVAAVPAPQPQPAPAPEMEYAPPVEPAPMAPPVVLPPPITGEHQVVAVAIADEPVAEVHQHQHDQHQHDHDQQHVAPPTVEMPMVDESMLDEMIEPVTESAPESSNDSGIKLADSAVDQLVGNGIADEVAEAVRRALAAIEVPQ